MDTMTTYEIINTVVAGGLLGVLGQGIRMAIGLKKLSDSNQNKKTDKNEEFSIARLVLSLFIGFVAGALYLLINSDSSTVLNKNYIFSIVAAGYSGADFIEGLFNTQLSKMNVSGNKKVENTMNTSNNETIPVSSFPSNERDDESTTNL